ncbi:MAG TPA: hypothetical protein VGL86_25910 [Polyangia bacterium]
MRAIFVALALLAIGCGGDLPPEGASDLANGDALAADMSLLPFGSPCMTNAQCASNLCFVGGNQTFCSLPCTIATQTQDCPVPPTSGTCNMKGYCKP